MLRTQRGKQQWTGEDNNYMVHKKHIETALKCQQQNAENYAD